MHGRDQIMVRVIHVSVFAEKHPLSTDSETRLELKRIPRSSKSRFTRLSAAGVRANEIRNLPYNQRFLAACREELSLILHPLPDDEIILIKVGTQDEVFRD
jgi:hypothetical protein